MTIVDAPIITKRMSPQDLLGMPNNSGMELVNGEIVEKTVSKKSSRVEVRIASLIDAYLAEHPVAEVYSSSLGYTCFPDDPDRMRKPDVSVVLLERLRGLPADVGYMPIVPDLAVEVISPNDLTYKIDDKLKEYLAAGFPLVWIADPNARTITVHPRNGRPVIFTEDDEITAESVLPGFRCRVRDFFPAATR